MNKDSYQDQDLAVARKLPANIKAEEMLLGAVLINFNLVEQVTDILKPEDFVDKLHQLIFGAIQTLNSKGVTPTILTVHSFLEREEIFRAMDCMQYMLKLTTYSLTVVNVKDYARLIHDASVKRKLILIGESIVNDAYDSTLVDPANDQIEAAENKLYMLANEGVTQGGFSHMRNFVAETMVRIDRCIKEKKKIVGISTGLIDLDNIILGLNNSDLIIIAGRPGMGKTAVALNLAFNACCSLQNMAQNGEKPLSVGFFSLEMSADQLAARLISMIGSIDSKKLRSGDLSEEDYNRLRKAGDLLNDCAFFIDDTPALSISAIRNRARKLKRQHNLGVLFVDYLQLLKGTGKSDNRVNEISEITQGLKTIAKELNIPVIALAQLSRAVEQREDKKPLLSDLRESGSIEQDADIVLFLYREYYYLSQKEPQMDTEARTKWLQDSIDKKNSLEIMVAKHRHGATGKVDLYFDPSFSKISNADKQHNASAQNYSYNSGNKNQNTGLDL